MVQALVIALSGRSAVLDLDGTPLLIQGRMVVVGNDEPVHLTDRERAVLHTLARRPGAVVSKRSLLKEVWTGETDDHVVEVTVGRLRRRLGPAGGHIETVMRRGYRLSTT
jgi:uroporphyrinogen-III synthase